MNNTEISIRGKYNDCINYITNRNIIEYLKYKRSKNVFIYKVNGENKELICMVVIKSLDNIQHSITNILNDNHRDLDQYFSIEFM